MGNRDEFGTRLRREREKRRVSLETIATSTKVPVELWEGLERGDFSRWPSGIFARAFVRDYARGVGLDADSVVDEFCRLFPQGDRRTNRIIQKQAELIGHRAEDLAAAEPLPAGRDRRRAPRDIPSERTTEPNIYRPRLIAAAVDAVCVCGIALTAATLFRGSFWATAGAIGLTYFTCSTVFAGSSPGLRILNLLRHRAPALFTSRRAVNA